jgi:hypothetical protein
MLPKLVHFSRYELAPNGYADLPAGYSPMQLKVDETAFIEGLDRAMQVTARFWTKFVLQYCRQHDSKKV